MKTIAHLPPAETRMIDLQRSLHLPHGSLTPGCNPEPHWRIEARREAEDTAHVAILAFGTAAAFTILTILAVALGWI